MRTRIADPEGRNCKSARAEKDTQYHLEHVPLFSSSPIVSRSIVRFLRADEAKGFSLLTFREIETFRAWEETFLGSIFQSFSNARRLKIMSFGRNRIFRQNHIFTGMFFFSQSFSNYLFLWCENKLWTWISKELYHLVCKTIHVSKIINLSLFKSDRVFLRLDWIAN